MKETASPTASSSFTNRYYDGSILQSTSGTNVPRGGSASKGGETWMRLSSETAFGLIRIKTASGKQIEINEICDLDLIAAGDAEGRNLIRALTTESARLLAQYTVNIKPQAKRLKTRCSAHRLMKLFSAISQRALKVAGLEV